MLASLTGYHLAPASAEPRLKNATSSSRRRIVKSSSVISCSLLAVVNPTFQGCRELSRRSQSGERVHPSARLRQCRANRDPLFLFGLLRIVVRNGFSVDYPSR